MRFEVYTLIDITDTGVRFNKHDPEWHKKQNFITLIQTIGLRSNPIVEKEPVMLNEDISVYKFGKKIKGKHNIWKLNFNTDFSSVDINDLVTDLDLVPIIDNLGETIKLDKKAFRTLDEHYKNTYFICVD